MNETTLKKRSLTLSGHQTSLSLEEIFWQQLKEIAKAQAKPLNNLVAEIDTHRLTNLSSAVRVFVVESLLKEIKILKEKM